MCLEITWKFRATHVHILLRTRQSYFTRVIFFLQVYIRVLLRYFGNMRRHNFYVTAVRLKFIANTRRYTRASLIYGHRSNEFVFSTFRLGSSTFSLAWIMHARIRCLDLFFAFERERRLSRQKNAPPWRAIHVSRLFLAFDLFQNSLKTSNTLERCHDLGVKSHHVLSTR